MINKNIIVNADDLGITPGTNKAIFDGYDNGYITSSSIMTNCDFFNEAINDLKKREHLKVGVHLNLTYGKPLNNSLLFCDSNGSFNLSYLQLVKKSFFNKKFLEGIKKEFESQIQKALKNDIDISHLDSHRHIHLIPNIYKIVYDLAIKYEIVRVRLITEDLLNSLKLTKNFNFFINGGLVKYLLLKLFTIFNKRYGDRYGDIYFYSILYTGALARSSLLKILRSDNNYEIMVHPSYVDLDKEVIFHSEAEKAYRLSENRTIELSSILK